MGGFYTLGAGGGGGAPAQAYLHQLAIDAGAKHVWFGPDDPLEDLVGGLDLVNIATGELPIPVPTGVRGLLARTDIGLASYLAPAVAGATIHKNADRSGLYLCRPGAGGSGLQAMMMLGVYSDDSSGPLLTLDTTGTIVSFYDRNWTSPKKIDLYNYTGNLNKWLALFWHWSKADAQYNVAWRLEDGAEQTGTLTGVTVEGSGTVTVGAGSIHTSMYTVPGPFHRAAFALADGDALYDAAFRAACYAALGWA